MSSADVLGRFVWHELMTPDTAGAMAFYSKVVPWRTAPSSVPGYTIWMAGQTQVGGLMTAPADAGDAPPHWVVYIGTPDVDATCSKAQGLGARVCKPPMDIPNVGRFAVLADPQGAVFAIFTPGPGAPPEMPPPPPEGGFSWHDLATTDLAASLRFYGELFGWRKGPVHQMGNAGQYQIIEHGGKQVGGIHNMQGPGSAAAWQSYVQVADCARAAAAAKTAGGRVLHGPAEVPGGSWVAVVMDPQGGVFAVHELPTANNRPKAAPALKAAAPPKAPPPKVAAPKPAPAPAVKVAPKPAVKAAAPKAARKAGKKAASVKKKAKPAKKKTKAAGPKKSRAAKKVARKARKSVTRKKVARKAARKKATPARRRARRR